MDQPEKKAEIYQETWQISEADYGKQFWERILDFNINHDWFLSANSTEYHALQHACLNNASLEAIAYIIDGGGAFDEVGEPVGRQKILSAVQYVKNELDALIARSDRLLAKQRTWNILNRQRPLSQVSLIVSGYFETNHLKVEMMEVSPNGFRSFQEITTEFVGRDLKPNEAYVYDSFEKDFLESNGIIQKESLEESEEEIEIFGEVFYKIEFDLDKLTAYDPVGMERYRKLHEEQAEIKEKEAEAAENREAEKVEAPQLSIRRRR